MVAQKWERAVDHVLDGFDTTCTQVELLSCIVELMKEGNPVTQKDIAELRELFESGYRTLFERHIPGARIEILSWSVLVSTSTETPEPLRAARTSAAPKACGAREVWDPAEGRMLSVATFARASIKPGARIPGPALILEAGTSTLVTATFDASTDAGGALVLERKKSTRRGKA